MYSVHVSLNYAYRPDKILSTNLCSVPFNANKEILKQTALDCVYNRFPSLFNKYPTFDVSIINRSKQIEVVFYVFDSDTNNYTNNNNSTGGSRLRKTRKTKRSVRRKTTRKSRTGRK